MEVDSSYLTELLAEKDSLDPSFVHCMRLLTAEINRVQNGGNPPVMSPGIPEDDTKVKNGTTAMKPELAGDVAIPESGGRPPREHREHREHRPWRRPPALEESKLYQPVKLSEKVFIPAKDHPKFNFVGKLLGPRGNTFKRLQNSTGTKMSILGKGSMRDREKEEELRATGEAKYNHLGDELHVLIEVEAPPGQAHARLGIAIEEIKKYLIPEMNDDIHQEQMREMAILNSIDDPGVPQAPAGGPTPVPVGRGRGRPRPLHPPQVAHPHPVGGIPLGRPGPPITLRTRVPPGHHPSISAAARSAAGLPSSPTMAHPAPRALAHPIGDLYGGMRALLIPKDLEQAHRLERVHTHETYDPTYAYEAAYAEPDEGQYYDYAPRVAPAEMYETTYPAPVRLPANMAASYKTPPLRPAKKIMREAAFPY